MWSILVNINTLNVFTIYITSEMISPVYHNTAFTVICGKTCESRPKKTCPYY